MMDNDRARVIVEALEALDVGVWRQTRYANDTGTCLWCRDKTLVMVPDNDGQPWYCQAKGAEALDARLRPMVEARLAEAAERAAQAVTIGSTRLSSGQAALLEISERLRAEGFDEALVRARAVFTRIMRSRFGELPPMVEQRIAAADFDQLERWGERIFTLPRPILVVA